MNWFRSFYDINWLRSTPNSNHTAPFHTHYIVICRICSHLTIDRNHSAPTIAYIPKWYVNVKWFYSVEAENRLRIFAVARRRKVMEVGVQCTLKTSAQHRTAQHSSHTIHTDVEIMMDDSFPSISMTSRWIHRRPFYPHLPVAHQTAPSVRTSLLCIFHRTEHRLTTSFNYTLQLKRKLNRLYIWRVHIGFDCFAIVIACDWIVYCGRILFALKNEDKSRYRENE